MPRTFSAGTALKLKRREIELIPLLEIKMWRDRFDELGAQSAIVRVSDQDRDMLGLQWSGHIGQWGEYTSGLDVVGALDVVVNNQRAWHNGRRLTDCLRFGNNNALDCFDPSFWDAVLYLVPKDGGSGDEIKIARFILEEPTDITESALTLRFSSVDLFLDIQDGASVPPSTIISVQGVGNAGELEVEDPLISIPVTIAGGFRYLAVFVFTSFAPATAVPTGVSVGGVNVPLVQTITLPGGTSPLRFYGLVNPPLGAPANVLVQWDHPVGNQIVHGAVALANVHQTTPLRAINSYTTTTASPLVLSITEAGDLALDAVAYFFGAGILPNLTVGPNQIQRVNRSDQGNPGGESDFVRLGVSTEVGKPGATEMSWTLTNLRELVHMGLGVVPAI